jgi:hypothetical protein
MQNTETELGLNRTNEDCRMRSAAPPKPDVIDPGSKKTPENSTKFELQEMFAIFTSSRVDGVD